MQKSKRPIGVFDSGLGGLTVMSAVMKLMPHEDILYFGDTAHVPYGSKSKEAVTGYALGIAAFLRANNIKLLVVACNTASAVALDALRRSCDIPVLGVIEPGAKAALAATRNGRIGIIGTEGTIRSGSYPAAISRLEKKAWVFSHACPLFVPLVEEGWIDHKVTDLVAQEYLSGMTAKKIDTLVLGCTHYPLLKNVLQKTAGPSIKLIDSAATTAEEVMQTLTAAGMHNTQARAGKHRFFVSDIPHKFKEVGRRCLGRPITPVEKVCLDK